MKQFLLIALMSSFLGVVVLIGIDREVDRRDAMRGENCKNYGYGMNQWAKSKGLPEICP